MDPKAYSRWVIFMEAIALVVLTALWHVLHAAIWLNSRKDSIGK
jgi:hypothetical protein